ncbi:MAG: transporter substrate-binding domain-containing protein, partial [Leptolyngbyaceae cyanobacterium]
DFAIHVIDQVGNYDEIYDRHFPELERDRNELWTDGGLLYSPPFSGSTFEVELEENDNRDLLADILERGTLKMGFSEGDYPGFKTQDFAGNYVGFDIDLGRAIAAALFGDASKLEVHNQSFKDGFANTANGVVDMSAMGITQNVIRDATLGIDFTPTYLYTGQGVMVRNDSGINMFPDLIGRRIGVTSTTTGLQNLQDAMDEFGGNFTLVPFDSSEQLFTAYDQGTIDAVSTDIAILSARISTLSNPDEHRVLDDVLSKEPLSMIVDENQSEWADVVRWVTHALVQAEEYGITSENIDALLAANTDDNHHNNSNLAIRQFLGIEGAVGKPLGIPDDFVINMIKAVGNYGEIYERNFGSDVLRRGLNELSVNSGLQVAAPFGNAHNDLVLKGTQKRDRLEGENGHDLIIGRKGNDVLIDWAGNGILRGDNGHDRLMGNKGDDELLGGSGHDVLKGGEDRDTLLGGNGNDRLMGGNDNDQLFGGDGDDLLRGGAGNDRLVAGDGNNVLIGGAGRDRYLFSASGYTVVKTFDAEEDSFKIRGVGNAGPLEFIQNGEDTEVLLGEKAIALFTNTDASAFS